MKRNEMKLPQVIPPSAGNQNKSTDALDFTSVYQFSSFSIGLHWTFGGTYNNFVNSSVQCITWHLLCTLRFFTRSILSISHIWPHCFISRFIFIRWCWFFFLLILCTFFRDPCIKTNTPHSMGACCFFSIVCFRFNAIFPQAIHFLTRCALFSRH